MCLDAAPPRWKADVSAKDDNEWTPLHNAAAAGYTEVIELLLSAGADVCASDDVGTTPLLLAGSLEAVNLLIDAGADPNQLDVHGRNAIFHARKLDVLKVLLSRGASAKVLDNNCCTTLHHAGSLGYDAAVLCGLYKAGVDPTLKNMDDKTAADLAREKGHETAAKMIDLLVAKHQASAQDTATT